MQYVNGDVLKIRDKTMLRRLQIGIEKFGSKIKRKLKRYKWIEVAMFTLVIFSAINIIMIYNFMVLLQKL